IDDKLGPPRTQHFTAIQQYGLIAELNYRLGAVVYKEDGSAVLLDTLNTGKAFALKRLISHGERFVHYQNIRLHTHGNGKCQSYLHATRIILDRLLQKLTDLRKGGDLVKTRLHLLPAQPQNSAVQLDILTTTEFRV